MTGGWSVLDRLAGRKLQRKAGKGIEKALFAMQKEFEGEVYRASP